MFYLIIASEIINGFRKMEDLPQEIRPKVEKAMNDLKSRKISVKKQKEK